MKKPAILFLFLLLSCHYLSAQQAVFDKYEHVKGVSTVFISKTMLRMLPHLDAGGKDISSIARKLESIRILNCERPSLLPDLRKQAQETFRKENYEIIMQVNDGDERTTIYQRPLKGGRMEFVLFNEEASEISLINLTGNITIDEIKGIMGGD